MEKNGREAKAPTRLQKHAPASLQLHTTYANPFIPSPESSSAIPLLSPLILSPHQLPELKLKEIRLPGNSGSNNEGQGNEDTSLSPSMQGTEWRNPAEDPFTEPSSLFSFFQTQCVIVNHAR
ncbi:Major viral transcription factor [Quillaja saponaria]|uniref:Major viral transcription factor n=1 Tax=Quillaja saponaria TaxID=32244 RepID=A0AAD7VMF3_QUISA|nr:Major viral transcription factor [Quillaja saponaria]